MVSRFHRLIRLGLEPTNTSVRSRTRYQLSPPPPAPPGGSHNPGDKLGKIGQCKKWIIEYLRDRKQFVKNNGIKSDYKIINYGIPQGTVLGPLLYLIYVNDIMDSNITSDLSTFADDTTIIAHGFINGRCITNHR